MGIFIYILYTVVLYMLQFGLCATFVCATTPIAIAEKR